MMTCNRPAAKNRTGLTALEFVGCVTAVIGGAWLGALYIGVDMQLLAHSALTEAELLDKVPADWRPEGPKDAAMTRNQLVSTLRTELDTLRSEILSLRTDEATNSNSETNSDPAATPAGTTQAYWLRVSEIALGETTLQQDAAAAFDEANAAKVFAIKGRISRFAAKAVKAVPTSGVDTTALQFGEQLGDWYERGGELYERAVLIWESPATNTARTQLNKDWRGAELHHRNEARLLFERAAAVRASLTRQFGEEFAEFAEPATPPTESETGVAQTGVAGAER